jgi:hypothetical protein
MKRFFVAAILLGIIGVGFAQTTPRNVAMAVFDRVYAVPMDSCHDASVVLNEDLTQFEFAYCGVIGDTLTAINQQWTSGIYQSFGYTQIEDWQYIRFGTRANRIEGYLTGFYHPNYTSLAALGIVYRGRQEATVIVLLFNRN